MVFLEIGVLLYLVVSNIRLAQSLLIDNVFYIVQGFGDNLTSTVFVLLEITQVATLTFSAIFRISTIIKTKEKFFHQRLAFLGCCTPSYPPYTPVSVLLNRSTARPLVRGESKVIIMGRALVITCIGVLIPAFGVYSVVIGPEATSIYTKSVAFPLSRNLDFEAALKGNIWVDLVTSDAILTEILGQLLADPQFLPASSFVAFVLAHAYPLSPPRERDIDWAAGYVSDMMRIPQHTTAARWGRVLDSLRSSDLLYSDPRDVFHSDFLIRNRVSRLWEASVVRRVGHTCGTVGDSRDDALLPNQTTQHRLHKAL
ncbi:hypothetical protein B0H14DRAFT_3458256 [Mycena olivaceomarginata]|nr:hypothetical protein B0H14DRAFT_3458256 [Mycena olivaceomarginata]